MSQCDGQRLDAYLDGELDALEVAQLEAHLANCPSCTAELERLRDVFDLFDRSTCPALDRFAIARIHGEIESLPQRRRLRFAVGLAGLAASVLVAASLLLSLVSRNADAPTGVDWSTTVSLAIADLNLESESDLTDLIVEGLSQFNHDE